MTFDGQNVGGKSSGAMIKKGISIVPEGRKTNGIFPQLSVLDNMCISALGHYAKGGVLNTKKTKDDVREQVDALSVKTPSLGQKMKYLSGGNQQKVILGRCMLCGPKILVMDEPTNGIDIGAKNEIYKIIDHLAKQGITIICISSELAEVLAIADRIIVMHEGAISGVLKNEGVTQDMIMKYASNQMDE